MKSAKSILMKFDKGNIQPYIVIAAGLLSIVGHSASPFLKFKGGKGVATSLGVIIGINPIIAVIAFGLWIVIVVVLRYVSVASIVAGFSAPVMMFMSHDIPLPYSIFAAVASLLIFIKHWSNLKRLISGTEPKFGQRVKLEEDNGSDK